MHFHTGFTAGWCLVGVRGSSHPAGRWWSCRRRPCALAAVGVCLCGCSVSPGSRTAAACTGPARSGRDEAARRPGGLRRTRTQEAALKPETQSVDSDGRGHQLQSSRPLFWQSSDHLPPSCEPVPADACSQLSWSCGKQWGSSLLSSTTGWSGRKSRQSRAAPSHSSSLRDKEAKTDFITLKKRKCMAVMHYRNVLRVPEGLEDLPVQVVAAVNQVRVTVSQKVWQRRRWWSLAALKHPFQQGKLHQV